MRKNFASLLSVDVRPMTLAVDGMTYIPAWKAVGLSGLPDFNVVIFKDDRGVPTLTRAMFGGVAVAVDVPIPGHGNPCQRIYLPVMDAMNRPIPAGQETARDVGDSSARCIARAIAIVGGLGLSLYSLCRGDGASYAAALNVNPDSDLSTVEPLRESKAEKGRPATPYLGWHSAVAAATITDPEFFWEVVEFDGVEESTGECYRLPAIRSSNGWTVAVRMVWKGREYTQTLPIMGVAPVQTKRGEKMMGNQPIANPTIFQWHSAVMRCLAKGIAVMTGYGLELYAKEEAHSLVTRGEDDGSTVAAPRPHAAQLAAKQEAPAAPPAAPAFDRPALLAKIDTLIAEVGANPGQFRAWVAASNGGKPLEEAGQPIVERALQALEARKAKLAADAEAAQTRH